MKNIRIVWYILNAKSQEQQITEVFPVFALYAEQIQLIVEFW